MKLCIICGCTEEEAKTQPCIDDRTQHAIRSTEARANPGRKHKER